MKKSCIFTTKGVSRTGASPPPPLFEKQMFVFVNFDCITRIYVDFIQHIMFTLSFLFTILTTKTYGMFEGASKQTPDLRILPRHLVLKFLDPPLTRYDLICKLEKY